MGTIGSCRSRRLVVIGQRQVEVIAQHLERGELPDELLVDGHVDGRAAEQLQDGANVVELAGTCIRRRARPSVCATGE